MITRWFLTKKQKSKGYWNGSYNGNTQKPQFTKQTALAKIFKSEQDAKDFLNDLIIHNKEFAERGKQILNYVKENKIDKQSIWVKMTYGKKIKHLEKICEFNKMENFDDNGSYYNYSSCNETDYKYYISSMPDFDYCTTNKDKDQEMCEEWAWVRDKEHIKTEMKKLISLVKFLKKEMFVNEGELVFKFNNRNKSKLLWKTTGDTNVNEDFCTACGCSAPNMPQLSISGGSYYSSKICVCCLAKIMPTVERELEKADQDVIEHYEMQTFLSAL